MERLRGCAALLLAVSAACADREAPDRGEGPVSAAAQAETANTDGWQIVEAGDIDGDGRADALWSNPTRNLIAVWLMRGLDRFEPGPEIEGPPGGGWVTTSDSDFNGDGTLDALWDHAGRNTISVDLLRGTRLLERGPEIAGPPGGPWIAAACGDVDGDGFADAVFHDPVHNLTAVYRMRGTRRIEAGPVFAGPPGEGWTVVTASDFNADGLQDILFYNASTQRVAVYLMRGTRVLAVGAEIPSPPGDGWAPTTASDVNLDGMADVIWNNPTTNRAAIWLMRGAGLLVAGPEIEGPAGEGWRASGAGDVDGDGLSDVFWYRRAPARMAIWKMRGAELGGRGPEIEGPR